jgi:hypothetical protein
MHHTVLYRRLKTIIPNLYMPMPETYPGWFPGKESGITCIWIGDPANETAKKKVCAITLGVIPEFTIKGKDGSLQQKGWRAVFARLIRARACTKADLERAFLVNLDRSRKGDGMCSHCARAGKQVKSDGGAAGLCRLHNRIQRIVSKALEDKKEARWLSTLSPERKRQAQLGRKATSSLVVLDLGSSPSLTSTRLPAASRQARRSPST